MTRLRLEGSSRRRRVAAAIGLIAVVVAAIAVILSSGLTGSTQAAGQPSKTQGATTVKRRDLIATDTESGTLSYANPQTVFNRMSGTVTWLPAIGQVIRPGQPLYKVDGAPVVLFNGTVPAYRDLSESDTDGPDIEQLKKNLAALGFDPEHQITINQTFDAATAAAVQRWQAAAGETQTGSISLGQIVFLPGAQRVSAVDSALGSTGGSSAASAASGAGTSSGSSGSSGSGTSTTASTIESRRPEFVSLTASDASTQGAAKSGAWTKQKGKGATGKGTAGKGTAGRGTAGKGAAGKGKSSGSNPTLAALLALLKAETLELQHAKSGGGSGAQPSGGSRAGGTSTAAAGRGRGGGGAVAAGGSGGAGAAQGGSSGSGGSAGSGGSGGSGSSASSGSGGTGGNAQPILQTTSTQLVVTVDLDATMQSEAVVRELVTVELPDGSTVDGKITQVSPVAQTSGSNSSASSSGSGGGGGSNAPSATVPVTITLTGHRHVAGLDQAAVSVNFQQQKATNVLSVPVSALLATAGGGYAIQEAAPPQKLIPVTPGLFAAGFVQISGAGVFPGLRVTDSQG